MKTLLAILLLVSSAALALDRPKLQIINAAPHAVEVFWINPEGGRVPNGRIEPGKDNIIGTTLGHRFVIVDGTRETEVVSKVPVQGFRYDPAAKDGVPACYTQRESAHGFPIVATAKTNPYALKEVAYLLNLMLDHRPDVRQAMIDSGARMIIMAHDEFTTDLPEFARMADKPVKGFETLAARTYWNVRARGLGGSKTDPFCSCAEENVLAFPGDPYEKECIVIHEFAHCIHLRGLVNVDPTFDRRLKETYDAAMKAGLWRGKYASVNHSEYWAEGVQSWFDDNRVNDHDHNHVHLRSQLIEYDPGLAALCREVFGETELHYTKPPTRLTGHMAGYDPAKAPTFAWPEPLQAAREMIKDKARKRDADANGAREVRSIEGWSVSISRELLQKEAELTEKALKLLALQLQEIVRVVPPKAVAELRKVPLYFNPEYPKSHPRAEYHPGAGWLKDNGRDPVMVKGVEFTNVRIFEAETRRMPNFALHELAHAYHDRVLGFENAEIEAAFQAAKAAGKYDKVQRQDSEGRKRIAKAYAMTNAKEYFAECSEAFFSRNDFSPFTKDELKQHDPVIYALLEKLWGA
ncbi:zinc-dependent peptidase [Prosthecobacter sp.]|uniref:zinc-dependent peptidase n=1 Tax=Prosthecobacter sp. TaxID=1965333 RepID=UPI00378510FA